MDEAICGKQDPNCAWLVCQISPIIRGKTAETLSIAPHAGPCVFDFINWQARAEAAEKALVDFKKSLHQIEFHSTSARAALALERLAERDATIEAARKVVEVAHKLDDEVGWKKPNTGNFKTDHSYISPSIGVLDNLHDALAAYDALKEKP